MFNLPKYPGKNKFIKKLIKLTQFEYYPNDDEYFVNLIVCEKTNIMKRAGGIKLKEINKDTIQLYLIAVPSINRNQGVGGTIMEWLIYVANENGFSIILTPSNVFNSTILSLHDYVGNIASERKNKIKVSELSKWYSKFGFVTDGKDEDGKPQMRYTPQPPLDSSK